MSARSLSRRRVRLVLLTGLLAGSLTVLGCGPKKPAAAQADANPNAGYNFATVNYSELAALHPSFGELKQLDEQIALVEAYAKVQGLWGDPALTLAYATQVIVRVSPWYDPQYLIPLAGMMLVVNTPGAVVSEHGHFRFVPLR